MRQKGEVVKRGTKVEGDLEFWEDGSVKSTQEITGEAVGSQLGEGQKGPS